MQLFFVLTDLREKLELWRQDYNRVRPHNAQSDRSPYLHSFSPRPRE